MKKFLTLCTVISFLAIMAMFVLVIFFKTAIASTLFFPLILGLSATAALGLLIIVGYISYKTNSPNFILTSFIVLSLLLGCFTAGVLTAIPLLFIISLSVFCILFTIGIYTIHYFKKDKEGLMCLPFSVSYIVVGLSLIGVNIPSIIVFISSGLVLATLIFSIKALFYLINTFLEPYFDVDTSDKDDNCRFEIHFLKKTLPSISLLISAPLIFRITSSSNVDFNSDELLNEEAYDL